MTVQTSNNVARQSVTMPKPFKLEWYATESKQLAAVFCMPMGNKKPIYFGVVQGKDAAHFTNCEWNEDGKNNNPDFALESRIDALVSWRNPVRERIEHVIELREPHNRKIVDCKSRESQGIRPHILPFKHGWARTKNESLAYYVDFGIPVAGSVMGLVLDEKSAPQYAMWDHVTSDELYLGDDDEYKIASFSNGSLLNEWNERLEKVVEAKPQAPYIPYDIFTCPIMVKAKHVKKGEVHILSALPDDMNKVSFYVLSPSLMNGMVRSFSFCITVEKRIISAQEALAAYVDIESGLPFGVPVK